MADGWRILTHGGAGSDPDHADATEVAAERAREALAEAGDPLDAACAAVAHLEDDPRFNAGHGSNRRSDGATVEMDAACAASDDRFGAVACVQRVANPVHAARLVVDTDQRVLAGEGARRFAVEQGLQVVDADELARPKDPDPGGGTDGGGHDTVGCVVWDGEVFAAALSSGGTREARVGRVGDVPLPGCGLHAGPAGAVAATGHGESITRGFVALRTYERLEAGATAADAVEATLASFPEDRSLGLIAVSAEDAAGDANRPMAYSHLAGEGPP